MSELQTVDHNEEIEVLVPLDDAAAQALDNRINSMWDAIGDRVQVLKNLLADAERGQIHRALGFDTWTEYVVDRAEGRWRLIGSERREMAQLLSGHGVTTRDIARITGSSKSTIARDITPVPNGTSEKQPDAPEPEPAEVVTVVDPAPAEPEPAPDPEPVPEDSLATKDGRRPQLPTVFRVRVDEIVTALDDLEGITADPRWSKAVGRLKPNDWERLDDAMGAWSRVTTKLLDDATKESA